MNKETNQGKEISASPCGFAGTLQSSNYAAGKICEICHSKGREIPLPKMEFPMLNENRKDHGCYLDLHREINRRRRMCSGHKLSYTQFHRFLQDSLELQLAMV